VSEPIYSRAPDVAWRLGPDRVLVQYVGTDRRTLDLQGVAAFVWISLDEPGTRTQIVARMTESGIVADADEAIQLLQTSELVVAGEHE
jgi:hypothetical protein